MIKVIDILLLDGSLYEFKKGGLACLIVLTKEMLRF